MAKEEAQRISPAAQGTVLGPLALAAAAMLATRFGADSDVCWDIAWTSAATAMMAAMLLARGRAPEASRPRWNLWALAAGSWLFAQLAWDVYGIVGFPSSPNLADAGWWGFAALAMLSMLRIPGGSWVRAVVMIESVPLAIAASALTLAELWQPAIASSLPLAAQLTAVGYPALGPRCCAALGPSSTRPWWERF